MDLQEVEIEQIEDLQICGYSMITMSGELDDEYVFATLKYLKELFPKYSTIFTSKD